MCPQFPTDTKPDEVAGMKAYLSERLAQFALHLSGLRLQELSLASTFLGTQQAKELVLNGFACNKNLKKVRGHPGSLSYRDIEVTLISGSLWYWRSWY